MTVEGRTVAVAVAVAVAVGCVEQNLKQEAGGQPAVVGSAWAEEVEEPLQLSLALPVPQMTVTPTLPA